MKHFMNNGKEYLKMTEDDIKYRQGRSKEQLKGSYMGAFIAIVGIIVILIIGSLL
jgi:hypothetical protein